MNEKAFLNITLRTHKSPKNVNNFFVFFLLLLDRHKKTVFIIDGLLYDLSISMVPADRGVADKGMNVSGKMEVSVNDQTVRLAEGDTGKTLASKLKKSLSHPTLVIRVNGNLRDLNTPLSEGDKVELLGFADTEGKKVFWHSSAHLLAQAVTRLFPKLSQL